jgi:hypothetical protein
MGRGLSKENIKTMNINDKYRLESDNLNITLMEKHIISGEGKGRKSTKEIGSEYWTPVAYYSTAKSALEGLVRREIKGTGFTDLETVVKKIDELTTLINRLPLTV